MAQVMASNARLGAGVELRSARPSTAFTAKRPLVAPRNARTAILASSKRQEAKLASGLLASTAALTAAGQAVAETVVPQGSGVAVSGSPTSAITVDGAVNQLIDAIKVAGGVVQQGIDVAGVGAEKAKEAIDTVAPYVKSAADTASPYVSKAVDTVKDVAGPAFRNAQPTLQSSLSDAQRLLQQQGLDTNAVQSTARDASQQAGGLFQQAKPVLNSAYNFLTTTPPGLLAEYAVAGLAVYWLAPPVLGLVFGGLRGYGGDISAPAALDLVSTRGNTYIVDLRSAREKESQGALDVSPAGRYIELEYASVEDRKLRSQLKNVSRLELEVTAMEVAALKKVGKGSTLLLVDRNGSTSKAVAKALAAKGFRRAFVVTSGFNGWQGAKLRVKPSSSVSRVEILPPAFGTISRASSGGNSRGAPNRRALPSGR